MPEPVTNADVARALGWWPVEHRHGPIAPITVWGTPDGEVLTELPDFLGDDALALRVLVPFLRARGYWLCMADFHLNDTWSWQIDAAIYVDGLRTHDPIIGSGLTLAAALSAVVCALPEPGHG